MNDFYGDEKILAEWCKDGKDGLRLVRDPHELVRDPPRGKLHELNKLSKRVKKFLFLASLLIIETQKERKLKSISLATIVIKTFFMNKLGKMIIYTDGSCLGNPGPGGWAFSILSQDKEIENICKSGGESPTTNNRMELLAVIKALEYVKDLTDSPHIVTDSQLTLNCGKGTWKRKANLDLWGVFDQVSKNMKISWEWVKAHDKDEINNLVDVLARQEAEKFK